MKKILFMLCMGVTLFSCEKDPDFDKLDPDLVVYTDYDKTNDFSQYHTYFLPDSIREITGHKATYWKDENAQKLIKEVENEMNRRGYTRITDYKEKENADLGLQLSYISETNIVINGGYFNGWWDYGYWGPWWAGWYYPYNTIYSYDTNTLIMEMLDLSHKQPKREEGNGKKIPVIWYSQSNGYKFSGLYNTQFLLDAINQAFDQSPYIKSGK